MWISWIGIISLTDGEKNCLKVKALSSMNIIKTISLQENFSSHDFGMQ